MATEQDYDDQIAPMMLRVAERCKELGMALVARVEWADGDAEPRCGVTQIGNDEASVSQRLTQLAAHAGGNFDVLYIEATKRFDVSQSIFSEVRRG